MKKRYLIIIALLVLNSDLVFSQFYNGHQMNFGKNRVQYDEFEWYFFRFTDFDTYFTVGSADMALQTARFANKAIDDIEKMFDHSLSKRIVFILYDNLTDFRQSNIGLVTDTDEYNIGGVTQVIDNVVFLYIEGDQKSLERQVRAAIANVILNEMLFGTNIRNKIANNTLISLPEWYIKGLVAYVSEDWNADIENKVKAGMLSGDFDRINHLRGDDAVLVGHSIWNFIGKTYGNQVIPTIVYLTRVTKNIESGFLYVLGINLEVLQQNWSNYYLSQFTQFIDYAEKPEGKNILRRSRKNVVYYQPTISPDGKYVAWAENKSGRYWIRLYDLETNRRSTILRRGHKLDQITDYSYPIIRWHPSSRLLGFIIDKDGDAFYKTYNLETEELTERKLASLEKVTSFNYSHDGFLLVMSAFNIGQSDIFIFNIAGNTIENLTMDIADDYNPIFINNSSQILFTSNRDSEKIGSRQSNRVSTQKNKDIFVYNIASKALERITNTPDINERQPYYINNNYIFLSDKNGVYNLYQGTMDSAVRYIDTITHYRYFLNKEVLTNYQFNIKEHNYAGNSSTNVMLYYSDEKFSIFYNENLPELTQSPVNTVFRNDYLADRTRLLQQQEAIRQKEEDLRAVQDSIKEIMKDSLLITEKPSDEILIDINNYKFDIRPKAEKTEKESEFDEDGFAKEPRTNRYFTTFYTNYLVNQVDFGFLNNSYQAFTGSAFYFNPGFNLIFKVGTSDLFEDYRITAGFRFAGNFDSNEYLLSFENLRKRWNKQVIFHRQAMNNIFENRFVKTHTHQVYYVMRYPFSQVDAFQVTTSLRNDRLSFLSIDYESLLAPNQFDYWAGLKAEYIFDNTRHLFTNIPDGFRMKVFGEAYKQLDKKETEMFVVGGDFRYYLPIHRNLIIATRFAASGSFGRAKLIYYLGGIDNWINLSSETPTFDNSIRIDPKVNYVYQAVATNMRGFSQNIRNGTNFAVVNAEIRWPIVSYLYNRPINNDFLQNFQVVGFFDVGSAWSGLSPFDGDNAYQNDIVENHPVTVIIYNDNYPIVSGYGFGVRSKLFGYFIRADWAWGIENNIQIPRIFYLSLSLDF